MLEAKKDMVSPKRLARSGSDSRTLYIELVDSLASANPYSV